MKTIEMIRRYAQSFAPWFIAITIILGCTVVLSNFSYNYVNSKSILLEIGFALIIAMGLLVIRWETLKTFFRSKIVIAMTAFIGVTLLATLVSIDPTISWLSHMERGVGMFFILMAFLGTGATILLVQETKAFRRFVLFPISLSGAMVGFSTIIGATGFNIGHILVLGDVSRGGGLTGNSSFAGTFLMMTAFITLYLLITTKELSKKILFVIFGIVTVITPVMINYAGIHSGGIHGFMNLIGDARGATISLGLGLLLVLGIYGSYAKNKMYKWGGRILATGVILATVIAVVMVVIPNNKIHNTFAKDTEGARFLYWNIAVQAIHQHSLIGTGPETYRYESERLFNPEILRKTYGGEIWADKPHNAYLEILVTSGILGGIAYFAMLAMIILALVRLAKKTENQVFVAVISGFLLAYLLNNFILFDIAVSYFIFFIMLFWVVRTELESTNKNLALDLNKKYEIKSHWFVVRGIVGLCVIVITLGVVIPELVKMKLVLNEMYAPLQTRAGMYQKSESASSFGSGLSFAERADVYSQNYQSNLDNILKTSPTSQKLVLLDIDSLISELETTMQAHPITTQGLVALGRLASERIAISGQLDENSLKELTFAGNGILAIAPTNMQGYWFLGQVAVYKQDYKTALDLFNKAIAIDPHIPESHLAVINLAQLSGNTALYNQALKDYQNDVIPEDRK